jgi:hypothetical protein
VIRPVSSQVAELLRLAPTPASPDQIGGAAVNRRVASSNLARGANFLADLFCNDFRRYPISVSNPNFNLGNFRSNAGV